MGSILRDKTVTDEPSGFYTGLVTDQGIHSGLGM